MTAAADHAQPASSHRHGSDVTKAFSRLSALYCMAGLSLWRTDGADGPVRYFAARWNQATRPMADLAEAEMFLERVKGERE